MLCLMLFLLSMVPFANSQHFFDCSENYCTQKENECSVLDCEGGRIVENATKCGCCDICIKNLEEGEDCTKKYFGWDDNVAECGPGLICQEVEGIKGKCVPTECLKKKKGDSKQNLSFNCDHFGNVEPVVCLDGVLCFCVDKNGTRIFGTDYAANNDTMKCDCSRDIQDFPKETEAENLPRCLPNGNYDPLQCTQNKCFCMESPFYQDDEVDNISDITKLSCYSSNRHENERKTECLKEREEQMKLFKKENFTIIGVDLIQCELDGTYSPLQCKGKRCSCVNRIGEVQNGYDTVNKESGKTICRCLRDKELMQDNENGKTPNMENFEKRKCSES